MFEKEEQKEQWSDKIDIKKSNPDMMRLFMINGITESSRCGGLGVTLMCQTHRLWHDENSRSQKLLAPWQKCFAFVFRPNNFDFLSPAFSEKSIYRFYDVCSFFRGNSQICYLPVEMVLSRASDFYVNTW